MIAADTPPTIAQAAATTPNPVVGTSANLTVVGADDLTESLLKYTWTATPAVTFSVNGTNAAKATKATFTAAGNYTFVCTITDHASQTVTSTLAVTVAATPTTVTVSPATASIILKATQQFTTVVKDQFNAVITAPTVTWGMSTTTSGSVAATGLFTANSTAGGIYVVTATSGTVSATAKLSVTNATPTIATAAGAAANPVTGKTVALSVLGADDAGEPALTYTWAPTATSPTGVTFSANGTNGAKSTTATFTKTGTYSFLCTAKDAGGLTVSSALNNVAVTATPTTVTVTPAGATTVNLTGTVSYTTAITDQFGATITPAVTWGLSATTSGAIATNGLFTANKTPGGPITVTATAGAVSKTATVTIANATPTIATAAAVSANPVTGKTVILSALGADDAGESSLTYTWSTTGTPPAPVTFSVNGTPTNGTNATKTVTATFTKAGTYNFQVVIADANSKSVTSAVSVPVALTPTTLSVTPTTATVALLGTQAFTTMVLDQFAVALAPQPTVTWTLSSATSGTLSTTGVFTANSTPGGSYLVTATAGAATATAKLTVTNNGPTVATAAAVSASPVVGKTVGLSVLGADDAGEAGVTYTWSTTGTSPPGVTFSANGTNAAKAVTATFPKAGSYSFLCTLKDGPGLTTTSAVNVTVNATPTTVTVAPAGLTTVVQSQTAAYTATVTDQFGAAITPAIAWSLSATTNGTIASTGIFTAAKVPGGPVTVTATAGTATGTAQVTVSNATPTVATAAAVSASPVVGKTVNLSVLGADDAGEGSLTYTWSTTGTPPAPVSYTAFGQPANGTNATKAVTATFTTAGTYTFQVVIADANGKSVTSAVSVPVVLTPTSITLTPTNVTIPLQGTQAFTAVALDQFGVALASQPTITWGVNATTSGTLSATGVFTANTTAGGSYLISATAGTALATTKLTVANNGPTVATAAAVSASPVVGKTVNLSVLGADDAGEAGLTYTWTTTGTSPTGTTFSANGTNAAKATTATFPKAGAYSFLCTLRDSAGLTVTSAVNVTVNATPTMVTVTPATASVTLQGTTPFTAAVKDQFGAVITPTVTWMLSATTNGAISSAGAFVANKTPGGPVTVTATAGTATGTAQVTVTNTAPTIATPPAVAANPVTTKTVGLTVLGADDAGEAGLTYTWSTTGTSPTGVTFNANGTNAAKSVTATFTTAGSYTFQVVIADANTGSMTGTVSVPVQLAPASIALTPATATIATGATQQFTAVVKDQFGVALATPPTVTWTASATTSGTLSASGLFTANTTPGGLYTITAATGAVLATAKLTVGTASNAYPTIATAAAVSASPVVGKTVGLSVLGADDAGEAGLTYTWSTTGTSPTGVTFSANGTNAAKAVTATFPKAGSYSFLCTLKDGPGLTTTSAVNVTVNATPTTVTVVPAGLTTVVQSQTAAYTATVTDQFGATITPTIAWSLSATTNGTIASTGIFTAAKVPGGPVTVTATAGTATGTAQVTVSNATPTVATAAAVSASPVVGKTVNLSVLGADDAGEGSLTYTWSTTGTPPAPVTYTVNGTPANGTNGTKALTANFTTAGTYTFQVVIADANGKSVTSAVSVPVVLTPTSITLTPTNVTLPLQGTQVFTAVALDQFNVALASQPTITWGVNATTSGTLSATGLFTANTTAGGSYLINATAGTALATTKLTVANNGPTVATAAAVSASPVVGKTVNLSVLGADDAGEAGLTYTWSTTGTSPTGTTFSANGTNAAKATTATFPKAGAYSFLCTLRDSAGLTATSAVNVTVNATPTTVTVTPATASVIQQGTTIFSAGVKDQFGAVITPTVAWTLSATTNGTISSSGVFTGAKVPGGPVTVTATAGTATGTAQVTVTNAAPTIATAAAVAVTPVVGKTVGLTVLGADDAGEGSLTYTWSTTGTSPTGTTFNANGTNAAKAVTATCTQAGTYTFQVVIADANGLSVTSTVSVPVNRTSTTITLTPTNVTIPLQATQAFTAVALDQFGIALAPQPTITWGINATTSGTLAATGIFTATTTAGGAYTVTAAAGSALATTKLTVTNNGPTIATAAAAAANPVLTKTVGLSVLGADDGGEAALTYTWSTTGTSPPGVTFSANGTNAAKATTATFTQTGSYSFLCTVRDTASITATSAVTVTVNATPTIVITPATVTVNLQQTVPFATAVTDQFGAVITSTIAWSLSATTSGTIATSGLFTANKTPGGPITVTATSGTVTKTAQVTVANAAPTVATAAAAAVTPVTGKTVSLSVLGADDAGEAGLTYTWSTTGTSPTGATFSANGTNAAKAVTATVTIAGTYAFQVVIADANSGSVTSTVSVPVILTPTTIALAPSTATIPVLATQQFTTVIKDQFGIDLSPQPTPTWTVSAATSGSFSATGLFTATGTPGGPYTVTAMAGTAVATAKITVANQFPTVATAPTAVLDAAGKTATLSILGADDGGEANLTYSWSTTGTLPGSVTYSANRTNAAKTTTVTFTKPGTYTFTCGVKDVANLSIGSPIVTVVVPQVLTAMSLSPLSASIKVNTSQNFIPTCKDQFGVVITPPTITWSIDSMTSASAFSSGYFVANFTFGGPYTITAKCGSISAQASISVVGVHITGGTCVNVLDGTAFDMSVIAGCSGAPTDIIYTWSAVAGDTGAISFSENGTNAARNTRVTFSRPASATVRCTASYLTYTETADSSLSAQVMYASGSGFGNGSSRQNSCGVEAREVLTSNIDVNAVYNWSLVSGPGHATFLPNGTTAANPANIQFSPVPGTYVVRCHIVDPRYPNFSVDVDQSVDIDMTGPQAEFFSLLEEDMDSFSSPINFTDVDVFAITSLSNYHYDDPVFWTVASGPSSPLIVNGGSDSSGERYHLRNSSGSGFIDDFVDVLFYNMPYGTYVFRFCDPLGNILPLYSDVICQYGPTVSAFKFTTPAQSDEGPIVASVSTPLSAKAAGPGIVDSSIVYQWSLVDGPAPVQFSVNGTSAANSTMVSFANTGTYLLRCTATAPGVSSVSEVRISSAALQWALPFSAPHATLAGSDTSVFNVDALAVSSFCPAAAISYGWSFVSGPSTASFSASGSYAARNTQVRFGAPGFYTLRCIASNGTWSLSGDFSVNVPAILFLQNTAINPNSTTGTTVAVTALAAAFGARADQIIYTWSAMAWAADAYPNGMLFTPNGTNSASSAQARFARSGTYNVTCTASYNGLSGTSSATASSTAIVFTSPPQAVVNPTYDLTADLQAQAQANDGETGIVYTWSLLSGPAPVTFSNNGTAAGTHTKATFSQPGNYVVTCTAATAMTSCSATCSIENRMLYGTLSAALDKRTSMNGSIWKCVAQCAGVLATAQASYAWTVDGVAVAAPGLVSFNDTGDPAKSSISYYFATPGSHTFGCTVTNGQVSIVLSAPVTVVKDTHFSVLDRTYFDRAVLADEVGPTALHAISPRCIRTTAGGSFTLSVSGRPNAVVTFTAMDGGSQSASGHLVTDVVANASGVATAAYTLKGDVMEVLAISRDGHVRFVVYRQ